MSMQFGGVGSGLPVNDWIDALMNVEQASVNKYYQRKSEIQTSKTSLGLVEAKFSSLRTSIEKLTDAHLASSFDLFDRKKATSSDEKYATATASSSAAAQKIEIKIESLATATRADGVSVSQAIDGTELFVDLNDKEAEEGTFSFYVDNQLYEFEVLETDTVDDIVKKINDEFDPNSDGIYTDNDLSAQLVSGKLQINFDNTKITDLKFGSNSDTSNFLNVMKLSTAQASVVGSTTTFESTNDISKVDTSGTVVSTANIVTGITEGTFTIGGSEFTIDANTTFSDLISAINNDDDAGVVAQFDMRNNKLTLIAEDPGSNAIKLENGTSNFLEKMGLVTGTDSLSSQTLGENAKVYLNDSVEAIEVNSNSITSDVSGITGVTINLKEVTEVGETISIDVSQDTDALTTAVEDFINKFNTAVNEIDSRTAIGKDLSSEYTLVSLRNSIRMMSTDSVDSLSKYDSFAMVGITTGSVGTSIEEETKALEFDKDKFLEALQENPEEVKTLLIGDPDQGITGILQDLESKMESVLDPVNGYFAAREDSMNTMISDLDKSIERQELRLEKRRETLVKQFTLMDKQISQMQQQGNALAML